MNVGSGYAASTNGAAADERVAEAGTHSPAELVKARPEILVGAAFAGGVLAAIVLRRLGR